MTQFFSTPFSPFQTYLEGQKIGRGLRAEREAADLAAADAEALAGAPRNLQAMQELMYSRPHMAKQLQPILDSMGENERKRTIEQAYRVSEGLKSGNTEFLLKSLQDEHLKYQRSGMADAAGDVMETIRQIEQNPKMALTAAEAALLANDPERFGTVMETPSKIAGREADTAKTVEETKQLKNMWSLSERERKAKVNKIRLESKELEKKISMMGKDKELTPDQKLKLQNEMTNQYLKEAGDAHKIDFNYNNILEAGKTGVGKLSTVLNFMKTIDPGSVVSGSEVATATNAPGWSAKMVNLWNNYFKDGKMDDAAFEQFKVEAKKIRDNAMRPANESRDRLAKSALDAGLDINQIFNVSHLKGYGEEAPLEGVPTGQFQGPANVGESVSVGNVIITKKANQMPVYEVKTPTGTYDIEAPEGADLTPIIEKLGGQAPVADNGLAERAAAAPEVAADPFGFGPHGAQERVETFGTDLARMGAAAKEMVTGEQRSTPSTEAAQDIYQMPELGLGAATGLGVTLATLSTDPKETSDIIANVLPNVPKRIDEKGNVIFTSPTDGKEYAVKPGLGWSDLPRGVLKAIEMLPAGRRATMLGKMMTGMGTEAAHQGLEAAMGGRVDAAPIMFEGAVPLAGGTIGEAFQQAAKPMRTASQEGMKTAIDATMPQPRPDTMASTPIGVRPQVDAGPIRGFVQQAQKAVDGGEAETVALAKAASPDPEVVKAAEELGVLDYMQPDHYSSSLAYKQVRQLAKSKMGSDLKADEVKKLEMLARDLSKTMQEMGGTDDLSTLSADTRAKMESRIAKVKEAEGKAFDAIREKIPQGHRVDTPEVRKYFEERLDELDGDVTMLEPIEKQVYKGLGIEEGGPSVNKELLENPSSNFDEAVDLIEKKEGTKNIFYHTSDFDQGKIKVDDSGTFGDVLFYSKSPTGKADEAGDYLHYKKDLNTINYKNLKPNQKEVEELESLLKDDQGDLEIFDYNRDEYVPLDIEGQFNKSDLHEDFSWSEDTRWKFQQMQAKVAKRMGYDGAELIDETGTVYAIPSKGNEPKSFYDEFSGGDAQGQKYTKLDALRKKTGKVQNQLSTKGSEEAGRAKQLYGALSEDIGQAAEDLGFKSQREIANRYTQTRDGWEKDMVALFSKSLDKELVTPLAQAGKAFEKGDISKINKILSHVPRDMKKQFMSSAIISSMGKKIQEGKMGYTQFSNILNGIKNNKQLENLVFSNLPEGSKKTVDNMRIVVNSIASSLEEIPRGGATLQDYVKDIDSVVGKMFNAGKKAGGMAAAEGVGTMSGAPGVATALRMMFSGKKAERDIVKEIAEFIITPEFDSYIRKAATGQLDDVTAQNLAKQTAFQKYAKKHLKDDSVEFLKNIARPSTRLPEVEERK